ncbi:MAG: GNAT family N-acetyltransferase [Porphyromonas sp.]|nr:GNAT family N-acetyltransferase [Porphyromonas sp.]
MEDDSSIVIKEVNTKAELKTFVEFEHKLYKGNDYYVPSLLESELETLDREVNPAFEYCDAIYFLAYRGDEVVGRIAGICNYKANDIWNQSQVRFGWFDYIDDLAVSQKLMQAVEEWGREKGCEAVHGPMGFTDQDKEGMLVEGFDQLGTMITYYNYPYYIRHMEYMGFEKDTDWVEYKVYVPSSIPEKHIRMGNIVREKYGLRVVKFRKKKEIMPYARDIFYLLNDTYKHLYGYVELTDKQIDQLAGQYINFLQLDFCSFIVREADNALVGFGITMPSMSRALQKAKGKLFPTGFIHLLRAVNAKRPEVVDMLLISVAEEYQNKGVNALIFEDLIPIMNKYHVRYLESNPELETNASVSLQWKYFKRVRHKRRRAYIKELD